MGLFNWLFGPSKRDIQKALEDAEKQHLENEAKEKLEEEKRLAEQRRIEKLAMSKKSDEEIALEQFEKELDKKSTSLDKARDTLYDKKAQLNTMRANQERLKDELDALQGELVGVERDYATSVGDERNDLEMRGQRLQLAINAKMSKINANDTVLKTFEKTIDILEKNIGQSDIELNSKWTKLESAKTAVAVIELNNDINNTLQLGVMDIDEGSLDVFSERQKLVLENLEGEVIPVVTTGGNGALALPFKERMAKEAKDVIIEETAELQH